MEPFAALAPLLLVLVAILGVLAWRYRARLLEHAEVAVGLAALVAVALLAGVGLSLPRRRKPAPPPEPDRRDETATREEERSTKAAAHEVHDDAGAYLKHLRELPPDARREELAKRRPGAKSGRVDPRILGAVVVVLLILAALALAACGPKQPPPVLALALDPIPEEVLADPPPTEPADTFCGDTAITPGAPLPADLVVLAARVPVAGCSGLLIDEGEREDHFACIASRDLAQAYVQAERTARERERAIAEEIARQRWEYGEDLRRENRALRWTGYGLGALGLIVGVGMGLAAEAVTP